MKMKIKAIIPQIIIPVPLEFFKFFQGIQELSCPECMKECKAIWIDCEKYNKLKHFVCEDDYPFLIRQVISKGYVERICFTAGSDLHSLKGCVDCIQFYEGAIIK